MTDNHHAHALKPEARLQEFEIAGVLGSGGFGITYRALDTTLSTEKQKIWVAIKEYFPRDHVLREYGRSTVVAHSPKDQTFYDYGFKSFQEEARTLARFPEHPNIVQIKRYFTANGTAYMVMPYLEGRTFGQWLVANPQPTQQQLLDIFIPVLDGLRAVHAENYLHRDLKPGNIYLRNDGRPLLIDFGAARQALGEHSKSLSVVLSEGYAAKEQYSKRGNQGAWTDIYGIGATLWRAVSGYDPEPATDRGEARDDGLPDPLRPASEIGKGRYSAGFLKAIDWALAYLPQDRPQTVKAFQDVLLKEWQGVTVPSLQPPTPQPAPPTPKPPPPKDLAAKQKEAQEEDVAQKPKSFPIPWTNMLFKGLMTIAGMLILISVGIWLNPPVIPVPAAPVEKSLAEQAPAVQPKAQPVVIMSGNYRISGDGTVTDTKTGLMWKQCSEGQSGKDCSDGEAARYKWDDAMSKFGKDVSFADYNDWRMPTKDELRTLVYCSNDTPQTTAWDKGCGDNSQHPTIDLEAFPHTPQNEWYWSSTARDTSVAWDVDFNSGFDNWNDRDNDYPVRLVRPSAQ